MKLNKKMIIMLASVIGVMVVLIIVIMLFVGGGSKVLSYDDIEAKLLSAGESYFLDNEDKLLADGANVVDDDTLVENGYLNDLSTYTEEDVTCNGKVYATKNPSGYTYHAMLDCGKKYSTKTLANKIIKDVVLEGSGLYEEEQVNPNDNSKTHAVYVFKGDNVNNYIKVGDYYWQIVKIYENGEIAVLGDPELLRDTWDNRYNVDSKKYNGVNDYTVSRIRDTIDREVVNDQEGYLMIKSLITTHTACVGKRTLDDTSRDGSVECSKVLENQNFSMIPVFDYMNASLDKNCNKALDYSCYNYNYLASGYDPSWTITGVENQGAFTSEDGEYFTGINTHLVYGVDSTLNYFDASNVMGVRLYAHLDANTKYVSGSGTYEDPYIVK